MHSVAHCGAHHVLHFLLSCGLLFLNDLAILRPQTLITLFVELFAHRLPYLFHLSAEVLLEHGVDLTLHHLRFDFHELLFLDQQIASKLVLEQLVLLHEGFATLQ